jgi:signal transduction histidine kinase
LHCVHSSKDPRGCGYANDCKLCIVRNSIERLIAEGGSLDAADIELELYRNGKSRKVWITVGVEPLLINGKDHWCIAMSDITERKEYEEALNMSKKLLSETELIGKVGGWEFNIDTMEQTWTDENYNIHEVDFNFKPNVENGISFYTAKSRPLIELAIQKMIELQESFDLELEINTAKGNLKSVHVIGKADLDNRKVYGFFQDITGRKLAEQEIKQKNEELQKLNATKDKFFSIIAHDLRSPFNGILGFSNILVDQIQEKNYEGIEEYALVVQKSAQRALSLLINLLDWSRSQIGLVKFSPEYVEIGLLIKDVVELFVDIAHQKKIELSIELPSKVIAFGDKEMLNTILRNLVSNAIKFSRPGGTVIISVEVQPSELTISVSDTGVGISKARIDKIFLIDQSNSTIGTQNEQGTELGMILCKEFVEKHHGKIWIESEVENLSAGKAGGTTIYFTLPSPANLKAEVRIPQKN